MMREEREDPLAAWNPEFPAESGSSVKDMTRATFQHN
jgi:hypothetical protein